MKKYGVIAIVSIVVTIVMTSCITTTVLAIRERQAILNGDVFEVAQGTVTYGNGESLEFIEHGKYIYHIHKNNSSIDIITPDSLYQCYPDRKIYHSAKNEKGTFYYSDIALVFAYYQYYFHDFAETLIGNTNTAVQFKQIAHVMCQEFSKKDIRIAGYKRIFIHKENAQGIILHASSVKEKCNKTTTDFVVPKGYKRAGSSIHVKDIEKL